MEDNFAEDVAKLTPPVGVSTLSFIGVPLSDMVYIMTILYLIVQIACTLYRTYKVTRKEEN